MNDYKFSIGEMAIAIGRLDKPNAECEIVEHFDYPYAATRENWYLVHVPGFPSKREDKNWIIPEIFLRKKQPPQIKKREMDQIVSWKDCGWKPKDVVVRIGK